MELLKYYLPAPTCKAMGGACVQYLHQVCQGAPEDSEPKGNSLYSANSSSLYSELSWVHKRDFRFHTYLKWSSALIQADQYPSFASHRHSIWIRAEWKMVLSNVRGSPCSDFSAAWIRTCSNSFSAYTSSSTLFTCSSVWYCLSAIRSYWRCCFWTYYSICPSCLYTDITKATTGCFSLCFLLACWRVVCWGHMSCAYLIPVHSPAQSPAITETQRIGSPADYVFFSSTQSSFWK